MVVFEAANALVNLNRTTNRRDLSSAISVLQMFCASPKSHLRFATVRTLNQASTSHPTSILACNLDLETLVTDKNRYEFIILSK